MLFTQDSDSWVYKILYTRSHISSTWTPSGISGLDSPTLRVDSFMLGVSKVVHHRTLTSFLKQVRDLLLPSGNLNAGTPRDGASLSIHCPNMTLLSDYNRAAATSDLAVVGLAVSQP